MNIYEVIDKQLQRLYYTFNEMGNMTPEGYLDAVKPLHHALVKLSENTETESVQELKKQDNGSKIQDLVLDDTEPEESVSLTPLDL